MLPTTPYGKLLSIRLAYTDAIQTLKLTSISWYVKQREEAYYIVSSGLVVKEPIHLVSSYLIGKSPCAVTIIK